MEFVILGLEYLSEGKHGRQASPDTCWSDQEARVWSRKEMHSVKTTQRGRIHTELLVPGYLSEIPAVADLGSLYSFSTLEMHHLLTLDQSCWGIWKAFNSSGQNRPSSFLFWFQALTSYKIASQRAQQMCPDTSWMTPSHFQPATIASLSVCGLWYELTSSPDGTTVNLQKVMAGGLLPLWALLTHLSTIPVFSQVCTLALVGLE